MREMNFMNWGKEPNERKLQLLTLEVATIENLVFHGRRIVHACEPLSYTAIRRLNEDAMRAWQLCSAIHAACDELSTHIVAEASEDFEQLQKQIQDIKTNADRHLNSMKCVMKQIKELMADMDDYLIQPPCTSKEEGDCSSGQAEMKP